MHAQADDAKKAMIALLDFAESVTTRKRSADHENSRMQKGRSDPPNRVSMRHSLSTYGTGGLPSRTLTQRLPGVARFPSTRLPVGISTPLHFSSRRLHPERDGDTTSFPNTTSNPCLRDTPHRTDALRHQQDIEELPHRYTNDRPAVACRTCRPESASRGSDDLALAFHFFAARDDRKCRQDQADEYAHVSHDQFSGRESE